MNARTWAVEEHGKTVLALPTGVSASDFVHSDLRSLQDEPGWIVSEAGARPWPILGFLQRDGQMYFWGEYHPCVRLEDCLDDPVDANLGRLSALAGALERLRSEKKPHIPLRTDGVFFLEDRSVLLLPAGIMQRAAILRPYSERVPTYHVINHPDLSGPRAHAFTVGALAYRMLMGEYPFTGEDDVEVNGKIRSHRITPPALQRPEIGSDLSDAVVKSIDRSSRTPPDLAEWCALLERVVAEGHTRVVGPDERAAALKEADRRARTSLKAYHRTLFLQKNGRLLAVLGGILVLMGIVAGSILSNVFAPRSTRGYTPQQVVETFYSSLNTLDHTTMEDTVVDKAGQGEINEATNLFVMSRVTLGYEGVSYILDAQKWHDEGRPPVDPRYTLYGAILEEVVLEQGPPTPVFRVVYEKWSPTSGEEASDGRSYGEQRVDRLRLRQDKGDWVIYAIERVESAPLTGS